MSDENDNAPGDELAKDLRKQRDAFKKQNDELQERLRVLEAKERHGSVSAFLKAKGLDETKAAKAAKFYQGEDVSEDAVGKWLEENADVFGVAQGGNPAPQGDPNVQAAQRVSQAAFGAADAITNIPQNQQIVGDPAAILHAINTLPMDQLQKLGYMPANLMPFQNPSND